MPVEFLHAVIAVIFLGVWAVVSQISFGHDPRGGSRAEQTAHTRATETQR